MTDIIEISGDTVLDERAGAQDDDLAWATFTGQLSASLFNHLFTGAGLNLPQNTGGTFPQVAWQNGFISLSQAVDDLILASNGDGDPFPVGGVAAGFNDITGSAITLFGNGDGNIVLGKNALGQVVLAVVLDETVGGGGQVTGANLYLLLFAALEHDLTDLIGANDTHSLADLIYLASATTSTTIFSDFSKVPSGQNLWTIIQPTGGGPTDPDILVTGRFATSNVNVSTQGLGMDSQGVGHLELLRFDFVNGGLDLEGLQPSTTNTDANISYGSHALGDGGGFKLTQVNPGGATTTVSALVCAYDAAGDFQGADFKANLNNQTQVNIESVRVYNASNQLVIDFGGAGQSATVAGVSINLTGDTALINGLKVGYRVEFTTSADMDRFTVQNVSSQTNRSFDLGEIRLFQSETTGEVEEIGSLLVIEDDGPTISTTLAGGSVNFESGAFLTENTGANGGADGGTTTIYDYLVMPNGSSPALTGILSNGDKTVTFYDPDNVEIAKLVIGATSYTFTMLVDAPPDFTPLDFSAIPPGSPQETLTVPAVGTSTTVTFNGILFTGGGPNLFSGIFTDPGGGSTNDDLNANSLGFGVKAGQASQLNHNQGFFAFANGEELDALRFEVQGIGGVKTVDIEYWLVDDGVVIFHDNTTYNDLQLPSGNNVVPVLLEDFIGGASFDEVYVRFSYDTKPDTSGVRVINFASSLPNEVPSWDFQFQFLITDNDTDTSLSNWFAIMV